MTVKYIEEYGVFVSETGDVFKSVSQWRDKDGYKFVTVNKKNLAVHRLVAKAFVPGETKEAAIVMHVDDDKENNSADNLSWGTSSQNNYAAYKTGRKTNNVRVRCMETGDEYVSAREAATVMFGIPKRGDHILWAIRGQRGKAYGFHWEVVYR